MQSTGLLHGARLQKALSEETALEPCRTVSSPEIIRLTKIGRRLVDCEPHQVTPEAFVDVPQKRIVFGYTLDGLMTL